VWRLWLVPSKNDVYIAARNAAAAFKVSLHQSGRWRVGFTNPDDPLIPKGRDRAVHKWHRPPELAPGMTRAFEIGIPATEIALLPDAAKHHPDTVWFEPPPKDQAMNFDVFLARPDVDLSEGWPGRDSMGTQLIFDSRMSNGEHVFVVVHAGPMVPSVRDAFARHLPAMREGLGDGEPPLGTIRGFLLGTVDEDGTPFFLDLRDPRQALSDPED
jgi:hypothetical protein